MPEFTNKRLGARFSLPDAPTLIQLLTYDSRRIELMNQPAFLVLWECAQTLIVEWECEDFPDFRVDLTKVEGDATKLARVIEWAGSETSAWRRGLDTVSKNS